MRFLLDANLPRSTAALLRNLGHEAQDVRDVLHGGADDSAVAAYARTNGLALLTRDFDFSDIRNYPPEDYVGIVVLDLPDDALIGQINRTLESFVTNVEWLSHVSGHLAIVEPWRVRFRPA
jgi:predicted nuclease of predicted toxin-antitoxin system